MVLSREVWNHAQIMDRDCHSNLLLYGFKYHFCDNSMATKEEWPERPEAGWLAKSRPFFQEWRTYLEFGVLETINNLMLKYKAWGYHLPEAFIWWMFYWLLESCQSLEAQSNHRFADAANNDMHPETYMLHNDMSHYNFYMQAPYENDMYHGLPLDSYPMPKMADFGLGQLTRLTSPANRARKIHEGTPAFKSPVSAGPRIESRFLLTFVQGKKKKGKSLLPILPVRPQCTQASRTTANASLEERILAWS